MACKNTIVKYQLVGTLTCRCKQEVGKPSQNKLRKGRGFQVGAWNVDSLTGRAGELTETLADREDDVACIQET